MRQEDSVAYLDGDLSIATASRCLREGEAAIDGGCTTFDLSDVEQVDSAALSLMFAWQRKALAGGKSLTFRNVPESLHALAALYGVDGFLPA